MPSFICPRTRCGHVTRNAALARLGYCEACREFTGQCGAAFLAVALYATGLVSMPGWPHPCTAAGTASWRMTGTESAHRDVVLCAPHGDQLRGGAAAWMESRGLKLAFLASRADGPVS